MSDKGVPITNAGATVDDSKYNVCQETGFKVLPGELIEQWDGLKVRPESYSRRNEQDFVRVHAEKLHGPMRPQGEDVFINTVAKVYWELEAGGRWQLENGKLWLLESFTPDGIEPTAPEDL